MLTRRKMFDAIMAAGAFMGASTVATRAGRARAHMADNAVAIAFGDADYLRERAERLAAHAAYIDEQDRQTRERVAAQSHKQGVVDRLVHQVRDMYLDGVESKEIKMTRDEYCIVYDWNMIDFQSSGAAEMMVPTFHGKAVIVT